ncbi:MAG: 3-deoxy-D-manno-octulosonic acid transferase [Pantoea sp. Brub]|nr:3-deoxy-D-manno-octulosonic acid transferase [Pantoea sp. Brub]
MITLYTFLMYVIQPFILLRLLFKSYKEPNYRKRILERYGYCIGKVKPNGIIIHAVSVGEILTTIPLIYALKNIYPLLPITITTMTPSSSEIFNKYFNKKKIYHVYLPYDLPIAINRFLNTLTPRLVIIMETELWPNIINILNKRSIPQIIANARLSNKSVKNYKMISKFMYESIQKINLIATQSVEDRKNFFALGATNSQLYIIGNLKFEISINSKLLYSALILRRNWAMNRPVWIASSTHEGEETVILNTHRALLQDFPNLLLILAPRNPDRFSTVAKLTKKYKFHFILRSSGDNASISTEVIIIDSVGELRLLYGIADLAFIGGTLAKHGGHNPLEAAVYGIPILMGPNIWNFKDICSKFKQSKGFIIINNEISLREEISYLLNNKSYRLYYGNNLSNIVYKNKGALKRLLFLIKPYIKI